MKWVVCLALLAALVVGCHKSDSSATASPSANGATGGGAASTPDVGAVTPAPSTTIDQAAGGGVNSMALKKARGIASEGVGSVNNAQRQGYGADSDTGQ